MASLLAGLEVGDPPVDALPDSAVSPCRASRASADAAAAGVAAIKQLPDPPWVDWELVRRGQHLWVHHLGRAISALIGVLLQGFTIARFAEVLHAAGYAQSPLTTSMRYRSTLFFIIDWFLHPLDQPDSPARRGIYAVRCMHSFARRRTSHLFDRAAGEGMALSQYDLGEVLLGFSGVCLDIMETELEMGALPLRDRTAMVATWRLIGWHLGILDEFNVCSSVERLQRAFDDFMIFTPQRLLTCRESTHALQASAVAGFGKHMGTGEAYWAGFLGALQAGRYKECAYIRAQPRPCMVRLILARLRLAGRSDTVNASMRRSAILLREGARRQPALTDFLFKWVLPAVGFACDALVWRAYSMACAIAGKE
jgi:hypothetical protein